MKDFILTFLTLVVFSTATHANTQAQPETLSQMANRVGQEIADKTIVPHEINNIKFRRILMGQPGLQMYVMFLSKSGQVIDYFVTNGKCVSSNKRLTPTEALYNAGRNDLVLKTPSYDGTFGSSDQYNYCQTSDGGYKQWNGRIYASNYPIELTQKPIVLDIQGK